MEWKDFVEYLGMVPRELWGGLGTFALLGLGKVGLWLKKAPTDQRKVLYNNICTLLDRDKGWNATEAVKKVVFGTHVTLDWTAGDDKLVVTMGNADQSALLYDSHRTNLLSRAKEKHAAILSDQLQNRAAGANMLVATLATQPQA